MREKVESAIAKIRSSLRGIDIILIDVREGIVKVHIFTSACASGIPEEIAFEMLEDQLREQVPEVKEVVAI
jgi:Fe-S cluster biogenesis protein NfuA